MTQDVRELSELDSTSRSEREAVHAHSGRALTIAEANDLAARHALRVIVLAGPPEAGKTTFLAGLYETFRSGPFSGFAFAGSRSLIGLEERCYLSRLESGLRAPDTSRTRIDATSLVHLSVLQQDFGEPALHFLLADLSGEHFTALRDTGVAKEAAPLLRVASDIAFTVDGARLVKSRERHACIEDMKTLLRVCHERSLMGSSCRTQIVLTKWDLVAGAKKPRRHWATKTLEELRVRLSACGRSTTAHRTAMRNSSHVSRGFGLEELLRVWASPRLARHYYQRSPSRTRQRQSFQFGVEE